MWLQRKAKDIRLPAYFLLHMLEVGDEMMRAVSSDCAAVTNYHRLCDVNNHVLTVCFVTVLKDRSPTSRCQPANLASCEGSLSGFQIATFLLCPHMTVNNSELSRISSIKTLITSIKFPSPNIVPLSVRDSTYSFVAVLGCTLPTFSI